MYWLVVVQQKTNKTIDFYDQTIRGIYVQWHGVGKARSNPTYYLGPLQWRQNDHHGLSNYWQLDCLFKRLLRLTPKTHHILRYWSFVRRGIHRWPVGSLHKRPVTRKVFSMGWRHHEKLMPLMNRAYGLVMRFISFYIKDNINIIVPLLSVS